MPASHLITSIISQQISTEARPLVKVHVPLAKSHSGQEFCLDDKVFVFDKNGKRISGKVKWAYRVEGISEGCVIGIETDVRSFVILSLTLVIMLSMYYAYSSIIDCSSVLYCTYVSMMDSHVSWHCHYLE